jgi:hypothetical protein
LAFVLGFRAFRSTRSAAGIQNESFFSADLDFDRGPVADSDTGSGRNNPSPVSKSKPQVKRVVVKAKVAKKNTASRMVAASKPSSYGQLAGLHGLHDALDLKSSVALVVDQDTQEVLFRKNDLAVLPIASITKLMTGLLISEARLPMDELLTITQDDVDLEKGSSSRLRVGTELSRGELLHLALMSSENRAANALGRTYPGGLPVFVGLMNAKAKMLGMVDTRYVEPTGLVQQKPIQRSGFSDFGELAPPKIPPCVNSQRLPAIKWRWGVEHCNTTIPIAWLKIRLGRLACKKPVTSPRRVSVWSCRPKSQVASSSWCFWIQLASSADSAMRSASNVGSNRFQWKRVRQYPSLVHPLRHASTQTPCSCYWASVQQFRLRVFMP